MAFRMDGKVAIVTGGGTSLPGIGIGCAVATVLAREGASVLVVDRDEDNAKATVDMIEEGGRAGPPSAGPTSRAKRIARPWFVLPSRHSAGSTY